MEKFTSKNFKNFNFFRLKKRRTLFFLLINVKMPTIVSILTFMSRKHFMLSCVEHKNGLLRTRVGRPKTSCSPPPPLPVILLLAVPMRLFCFGSLVTLDVVCRYLSLFLLYINMKIGKNRC